jgi:FKBP-type peptidyl-prolyl cis-trans isomerase FkpA
MKKIFYFVFLSVLIASCGEKSTDEDEPIVFTNTKDKISYVLGSMNAQTLVGSNDKNVMRLDMNVISEGFSSNLNTNEPKGCEETFKKLFGPYYQDFDSTYAKDGALCLGKMTAYAFYRDIDKMGAKNDVNFEYVKKGFKHGLLKKDTIVSEKDKQELMKNFIMDINVRNGNKMMAAAKKVKGVKVYENGIIMQTILEGKGGNPGLTDDVKVEYILTNANGDTVQSSYDMKKQTGKFEPVALKLNGGVIPGWSYIVPKMKKGGKYRIWVPWNLAYGESGGKENLCFLIELIDYAKEGSFVKDQPQPAGNF